MMKLVLTLVLLLGGCAQRGYDLPHPGQAEAHSLFIPIACDGRVIGSAFPVAPDMVMTAAHVSCRPGEVAALSLDQGRSWRFDDRWQFNATYDLAIIEVEDAEFEFIPELRAPVLGEEVRGYGAAYGDTKGLIGFLSNGIVAQATELYFWCSNEPIGGMSGSAVVGEDGAIVGMVNHGHPDGRVGGSLSGGLSGNLLSDLLDSYLEYKASQEG